VEARKGARIGKIEKNCWERLGPGDGERKI
jgi:hypothetical protein